MKTDSLKVQLIDTAVDRTMWLADFHAFDSVQWRPTRYSSGSWARTVGPGLFVYCGERVHPRAGSHTPDCTVSFWPEAVDPWTEEELGIEPEPDPEELEKFLDWARDRGVFFDDAGVQSSACGLEVKP